METKRTKAEQARINGAKSKGPKTKDGKRRSQQANLKHGLYAKAVPVGSLFTESEAVLGEIRSHFTAYWEPKGLYEARKVEQLVRYAMELDRLDCVRQEKMHDTLADVAKRHPHLVSSTQRTAEAELRASIPGGAFELLDLRVRRINSEISRLERDLLRLKKYHGSSGPTDMLLKTLDGTVESTNMNQRPFFENPTASIPAPPQPASVTDWAKSSLDFTADPYQQEILDSTEPKTIVCGARQTGKSTAAAIKALHEALTNDDSLIILAGPSGRQSGQIMEKAKACAIQLATPLAPPDKNCDGFKLPKGSQIVSVPATPDTIRGFSNPRMVIVDDASFVDDAVFTEALIPMQALGASKLLLISSPGAPSGFFYERWRSSASNWNRIKVDAAACPRIAAHWLGETRAEIGEGSFKQEFACEFRQDPACPITREMAENALRDDIAPLFPNGVDA
ncbi:MAG: terminase large subunit domain-containing protein [Bryobacteraceae bacterium]